MDGKGAKSIPEKAILARGACEEEEITPAFSQSERL
jgi:hypothetical protein